MTEREVGRVRGGVKERKLTTMGVLAGVSPTLMVGKTKLGERESEGEIKIGVVGFEWVM